MITYTFDAPGALARFLEDAYTFELETLRKRFVAKNLPGWSEVECIYGEIWDSMKVFVGLDSINNRCEVASALHGLELCIGKHRRTKSKQARVRNALSIRVYSRALLLLTEANTGSTDSVVILETLADMRKQTNCEPLCVILPEGGMAALRKD